MYLLKISTLISLLFLTTFAGWDRGGSRGTEHFDPKEKLSPNDTIELKWHASENINDYEKLKLQNCKYDMIINEVNDRRDNENLIGTHYTDSIKENYYTNDFSIWCLNTINSEITEHCGRYKDKKADILVDIDIMEFLAWERHHYHADGRFMITFRTADLQKIWTSEIEIHYEDAGEPLTPFHYQQAISNTMVRILAWVLSLPVKESLVSKK